MARITMAMYAYFIVATILMAMGVVPLLVLNMGTSGNITLAALAGAVLGAPVAWLVSKAILRGHPQV